MNTKSLRVGFVTFAYCVCVYTILYLDEPPPLEDMMEELERAKHKKEAHSHVTKTEPKAPAGSQTSGSRNTQSRTKKTSEPVQLASLHTAENSTTATSVSVTSQPQDTKKKKTSGSSFGGFQKGFLSGSKQSSSARPSAKPSKTKLSPDQGQANSVNGQSEGKGAVKPADDVIRPKQQKSSSLEFPEVQEAMKESFPFLNTDSK